MAIVAAANASPADKTRADYTCIGRDDQRTIARAYAGGARSVRLTEGDFSISGPILVGPLGKRLVGEGPASVLVRATGYTGEIIDVVAASEIEVADLAIDDLNSQPFLLGAPAAVRTHASDHVTFRNLHIRNTFRIGINVSVSSNVLVDGCTVLRARAIPKPQRHGGHGILVWSPEGGPRCKNVKIRNCTSNDNWRTGLYAVRAETLSVEGCSFENNSPKEAVDAGIEGGGQIGLAFGCTDVTIMGNTILGGWLSQGMEADVTEQGQPGAAVSQRVTITGNVIKGQGHCGILIYSEAGADFEHRQAHVTIQGNMLSLNNRRGNTGYGAIQVQQVTDVTVQGNTVDDDAVGCPGIRFAGAAIDRYTILGNHVSIMGARAVTAKSALDDQGTLATTRTVGPNTLTVNGKVV